MGDDYKQGWQAYCKGILRHQCPHEDARDDRRKLWLSGWDDAELDDAGPSASALQVG